MGIPYPIDQYPMVSVEALKVIQRHPNIALNGLAAIKEQTIVEASLRGIFASLLGDDAYGFGDLQHVEEKFIAKARVDLPPDDVSLVDQVLSLIARARRETRHLADGLWGLDDKFPDSIVVMDFEIHEAFTAMTARLGRRGAPTLEEAVELQNVMRSGCSLWSAEDMASVKDIVTKAFVGATALNLLLKSPIEISKNEHRTTLKNLFAMI